MISKVWRRFLCNLHQQIMVALMGINFQSPRQGVVSKEAPTYCIGEEQLGTQLHCQCPFADKVATPIAAQHTCRQSEASGRDTW